MLNETARTWALVLAAGEGRRLKAPTTDADGTEVPMQYCSLAGGRSLLQSAMDRARSVAGADRVSVVVAAEHRRWWWRPLQHLPARNVVVQPRNFGTGNGIPLQLLHIAERDAEAAVVLLPSDHVVLDESLLRQAMEHALNHVRAAPEELVFLGRAPAIPNPEPAYIVPGPPNYQGVCDVLTLLEQPTIATAARLVRRGARLDTLMLVASCKALLRFFELTQPDLFCSMQPAMDFHNYRQTALAGLYGKLPVVNFSREVLGAARGLPRRVKMVPDCGWSDLGTLADVGTAAARLARGSRTTQRRIMKMEAGIDLAARYARLPPSAPPEQRASA